MQFAPRGARALVLTALLASWSAATASEALRLRRLPAPSVGVEVLDALGGAVDGATVTFVLGPGATFASGLRTEVVTSDEKGRAQVLGILADGENSTKVTLKVTAAYQGERATLDLEARPRARKDAAVRSSSSRKWLYIAIAAGGAIGAAAMGARGGGGGTSAPAAITTPPATTPTLGTPTVIVLTPKP